MKNFKKVVFGLLAMLVMVTGVNAEKIDYDIQDVDKVAKTGFTTRFEQCTESTEDYVRCTVVEDGHNYGYAVDVKSKDAVLTVADGVKLTVQNINVEAGAKLTIRVEGNGELIISGSTGNNAINVAAGASLVIDYGKVTSTKARTPLINVTGDTVAPSEDPRAPHTALVTSVVVNSGAILTSKYAGLHVINGYVDVTLNGDWKTDASLIYVTGGNSSINVAGGKYVSAAEVILVTSGTTGTITVNGGTFTSTAGASVVSGSLVVNNGTMDVTTTAKTNTHNALTITGNANLTVNGGEFKADQEVLNFNSTGNLVIADGRFISLKPTAAVNIPNSGKDSVVTGGEYTGDYNTEIRLKPVLGEGLKAVRIGDTVYVGKEHKLDIEVVEENGKIVELHTPQNLLGGHTYTLKYLEDNRYLLVEANEGYVAKYVLVVGSEQTLVKDGEFTMPDSDAKLVVTFVTPDELNQEMQNPVNPDNGGENDGEKGDENTNTNPGTFDGIATIVTMAVSSLSAAGYSIKKIVRK